MFGIPNPWIILGGVVVFLAIVTGVFFEGRSYERKNWEVAIAAQKQEAAAKLTAAIQHNADLDAKNSELARNLDEVHHAAVTEIDATRDAFGKRLRDAERRGRCASPGPAETAHPGQPADASPGGDDQLGRIDLAAGERLREVGLKLQADVKECWNWAASIGR